MLSEAFEKYGGRVQFISITKDAENPPNGLEGTRAYVEAEGLGWMFGEGQHVVEAYSADKIPHTVFIDGDGFIVFTQQGFMEPEDMEFQLQRMLGEVPQG